MKLLQHCVVGVTFVGAILLCNACSKKSDDRVGTTTVTSSAYGVATDLVVTKLVAARCARETACNNIGPEKHFVDPDICTNELSTRIGMDLKPSACPQGVDPTALDRCLDAIKDESCSNPVETAERLATCRTSALCGKP